MAITVTVNGTATQYIKWLSAPHPIPGAIQTHIQVPSASSAGYTYRQGTDNASVTLRGIVWYSTAGAAELDSLTNAQVQVDNGVETYLGYAGSPVLSGSSDGGAWLEFSVTVTLLGAYE
jgi:hypothetical protein